MFFLEQLICPESWHGSRGPQTYNPRSLSCRYPWTKLPDPEWRTHENHKSGNPSRTRATRTLWIWCTVPACLDFLQQYWINGSKIHLMQRKDSRSRNFSEEDAKSIRFFYVNLPDKNELI
jgi:hypothetical protein